MLDWLKATGCVFALFLGVFALASAAQAGPEDGRIVNGSGSISQSGTHTDIRQNSDFLATHWGSFNIAANESVQAHQPGSTSRLLIRVDGGGTGTGGGTNIAGSYTSNGITILENRNGVQFSRGAIVNVGGLLATSSRITGADGANWQLDGVGGAVVNHGQIVAGAGGAILAAVKVQNTGDITAKGGDVALGAGSAFTVDFAGSMVGFEVRQAASGASLANTGKIEAQGGVVSLSAQEAQAVRTNVVSVGGVVKATRIERRGGVVYLSGGTQGIAEVSGDVSASKKVQTTGEYVVVKDGALLKAPEILVGGDFQGGGDVQTARRTLVERGALLDAGAEGRVIVWSDETTWFNGDISAPGGFAEVSGKETLASVHLAGIDVGELLLDPADIIIAATSTTTTAVTTDIAAADPGGTMTLGVNSINTFTGDLSLAASDTITVNVAISKMTGDLSLIAGGNLTVGANIDNGANTLTLTAGFESGTGDLVACPTCTLTASTVSLTQDSAFGSSAPFMFAAGTLNLTTQAAQDYRGWMAAMGRNLSIDSPASISIGSTAINLGTGNLTLDTSTVILTNATGLTITAGDFQFTAGSIAVQDGVTVSQFVVIASGDIILDSNIILPTSRVELRADTGSIMPAADRADAGLIAPFFMASSLFMQQMGAFADDVANLASRVSGAVELRVTAPMIDQVIHPWMTALGGTDFSLRGLEGEGSRAAVVLDSITLPATLTRTGDIDLQATTINLTATSVISGANVALTGAIDVPADNADDIDLTIAATGGAITINDNISLSTSTSGGGTITLTSSGSGSGINLGAVALTGLNITLNGVIASANNDLTLTVSSLLALTSNIDRGTGNLTLALGSGRQAELTGVRMLSGNVVTIGGTLGLETDGDLTISAGGNLMVNTNISLGSGATTVLRLEAGRGMGQTGDISFSSNTVELRASRFFLTQNGAVFGNVRPVAFQNEAGIGLDAEATELITRITYDGTETQAEVDWANILPNTVSRGPGGTADYAVPAADFVSGVLAAAVSIILDAGTGVLTFAATGDITLRAPAITITAGTIDLGADRTLTLTAETGTLTLNFTAATTITGTGMAGLTVIAEDIAFSGMPPILNVPTVSLELTDSGSSFGATAPFAMASMIGTLNITTNEPATAGLEYRDWMAAVGRNLTITSATISINSTAINLGTGNLTFNSGFGIRLTNMAGLTITAGNVTFPVGGFIAAQGVDVSQLVVMASGDIVISDTRLPTARVELRADNGNITINPDTVGLPGIRVDFLLMRQMGMFADNFISSTNSDIRELILRTTTAVDQPIHGWMRGAIGDPNNSGTTDGTSFSLAGEGVVLTSITTAAAADFGMTAVDLQATAITLGGALTAASVDLRATVITLGGALTGGVVALRSNMITGGSANLVAIHAMTGDITSTGADGTGRPALATDVTGFSLTRSRTFGGRGSLPFTMTASVLSAITAITLSTRSPQIVLSWMINPDRNLTITSASTVRVNAAIGSSVPGRNFRDGNFSLTSTGGLVRILFGISTGGNLTLIGSTAGINLNSGAGAKTLRGATVTLTGNARSNRALTLDATSGALTLNGDIALTGTRALSLSGGGGIALGGALTLTGGAITLNNAVTGEANLTITASRALTINNSITLTGADLTLALSGAGAIVNGGTATLTASTVSLEQDAVFTTTEPFAFGNTGSLELTTDAAQVVHDWMIADGRNLTVTSALNVVVRSAIGAGLGVRDLGDGNITLTSTGGLVRIFAGISTMGNLTLSGNRGINLNSGVGAKTLRGEIVTLIGDALSNRDLTLNASTVRITQDAAFGETGPGTMLMFGTTAPDSLELTTDAAQVVHDWMIADGRNLTVTSAGIVRVTAAIGGSGGRNLGDGSLTLVSTGGLVRILENISTTGNITLNGADGINFNNRTAKTLSGATVTLTGVVVSNRDLALTASGTLRFNNNITLNGMRALSLTSTGGDVRILGNITTGGDLTLNGNTGIDLRSGVAKTLSGAIVTLTGMVVSNRAVTINASGILRLNNNIALTGTRALSLSGSGGITLGSALTTLSGGAITLRGAVTGTADLTITARGTLTINNDIDIGTGALTLTSTGGAVRILANISTGGDLTLNGATGINLRGGGAKTFSGADITLTGAARSNRDLTITATGVLTINNNINIGTRALSLTGTSLTFGSSVDLTAGDHIFDPTRTCDGSTTNPTCTDTTP